MIIMQWNRGINYRYNGKHIPIYKCIKFTCCTHYIHTKLCVKYISIKKRLEKKSIGINEEKRYFFEQVRLVLEICRVDHVAWVI